MHPDAASGPENAAPTPRSVFSPWATLAYALLWAAVTLYGWRGFLLEGHAAELAWPLESAARVVGRDVALAGALDARPAWERRLWALFEGTPDELREGALEVQREAIELAGPVDDPGELDLARTRLAVLLAETGDLPAALDAALAVEDALSLSLALTRAYAPEGGAPEPFAEYALPDLDDWAGDRLRARLARHFGAEELAAEAERAQAAREAAALRASGLALGAQLSLVAAGLALLAAWAARRRVPRAPPERRGPPPWSLATGLGVLVRGDFWSRLYFVALVELAPSLGASGVVDALYRSGTVIGALPLVALVWRHLLAPSGGDPLGLRPRAPSPLVLAGFALAVASVDLVITDAVGLTTWALGSGWDWAESFDEDLILGSPRDAALMWLDLVVFAPCVEELGFRGVLYFSLRRRLAPLPAAAASALVFAALHFYSVAGLLATFASGLVWALAFERVRSLWPGIGAHALYNALYATGVLLAYR
jgi:membrane protease YdiL (CAAX protease family)